MLSVIEYDKDEYDFPALIVLGCFDALHAGHRELLKKAKLQAKINGLDLGVMMFRDGKGDKLVYSFEERIAILEQFNVKFVLAIDFTDEFKKTAPLDFLEAVEDKINVKAYMSGKDFRFGEKAKGKSSTLKSYAEDDENGVWYIPVKDVEMDGEKISTTLIKSYLGEGNVAKANALLGSEFTLTGEVVKGAGRGTSVVGFPTVNIVYPEWKQPIKHGVYSVKCMIGETDYQGVANFGTCPTFGDDRVALEVYFEGFSGDLYGQVLTIRFIDFVRDIEEFVSADELSGQIKSDLNSVNGEAVAADATVEEPAAEQPVENVEEVAEEQPVENVEEVIEEQPVESVEEIVEEQPVENVADVAEVPAEEVTEQVVEEREEVGEGTVEEQSVEAVEKTEEASVEEVNEAAEITEEIPEAVEEQPAEESAVSEVIEKKLAEIISEDKIEEEHIAEEQTEESEEIQVDQQSEEPTEVQEGQTEAQSEAQTEETEEVTDGGEQNVD